MESLPYVVLVANCCVMPLVLVLIGIAIGKYGLPVVWNPNYIKNKRAAAAPRQKQEKLFTEVQDT